MSSHFSRLFLKSNSSFPLQCGNVLQSSVQRLRDKTFLLDTGFPEPVVCPENKLTRIPADRPARFNNKVGFVEVAGAGKSRAPAKLYKAGFTDVKPGEHSPALKLLENFFVDLVVGEPRFRDRAAMRLAEMVGPADVVAEEWQLISPVKYRQHRAWKELTKMWRRNKKVKGFFIDQVKGGYAVAISGFVAFLPRSFLRTKRISDHFMIDQINPKTMNFVVK